MAKCTHVQECSTKLLNFYVNDFLSLAQIKNKKFRKDCSTFDVKECVQEVISIQQHKADYQKIDLAARFYGFENDSYLICTDMNRLQQVLLNFQSNALKFTKTNGRVTIHCHYQKDEGQHGSIYFEIEDTGVGISQADQSKLFKKFGFIDSTKEINA